VPDSAGKQALTAVFSVRADSSAALEALLEARAPALRARLAAAPSLHFARFCLLDVDGASDGRARLILATTFDGRAEAHLDELWSHARDELEPVFRHCTGWVSPGARAGFGRFVAAHSRAASVLFSAQPELSVERIHADGELRLALSRWLTESESELRTRSALEVAREAQARLAPVPAAAWPAPAARSPGSIWSALSAGDWLALSVTALRSFVHDAVDWLSALWHDTPGLRREPFAAPAARAATTRCFSHTATLKPGSFRRVALRLALRVSAKLARAATVSGKVSGLEPVHAARLMLLDDGRLLFFAELDASLESALAHFSARASALFGMIWSHTRGFPSSFGFGFGGARDAVGLRAWAEVGSLRTPVCFSAYPELGAREISENAEIRRLLASTLDEAGARRLLSLVRD
jgi:hypothetical protein